MINKKYLALCKLIEKKVKEFISLNNIQFNSVCDFFFLLYIACDSFFGFRKENKYIKRQIHIIFWIKSIARNFFIIFYILRFYGNRICIFSRKNNTSIIIFGKKNLAKIFTQNRCSYHVTLDIASVFFYLKRKYLGMAFNNITTTYNVLVLGFLFFFLFGKISDKHTNNEIRTEKTVLFCFFLYITVSPIYLTIY